MREAVYQHANTKYIHRQLGYERKVPICVETLGKNCRTLYYAVLVSMEKKAEFLQNINWEVDFKFGYPKLVTVSGAQLPVYKRFGGLEGVEPLVYKRCYNGRYYSELSEEFRLINNLYYDEADGEYVNCDFNYELVARVNRASDVYVNINYIKRFLAVKQMHLAVYFDITRLFTASINELGLERDIVVYRDDNICYDLNISEYEGHTTSRLYGKKFINALPFEECEFPPFEKLPTRRNEINWEI